MDNEKQRNPGDQGRVNLRVGYDPGRFGDENARRAHEDLIEETRAAMPADRQYEVAPRQSVLSHDLEKYKRATVLEAGEPFTLADAGHTDLLPWERLEHFLKRGFLIENYNYNPAASGSGSTS